MPSHVQNTPASDPSTDFKAIRKQKKQKGILTKYDNIAFQEKQKQAGSQDEDWLQPVMRSHRLKTETHKISKKKNGDFDQQACLKLLLVGMSNQGMEPQDPSELINNLMGMAQVEQTSEACKATKENSKSMDMLKALAMQGRVATVETDGFKGKKTEESEIMKVHTSVDGNAILELENGTRVTGKDVLSLALSNQNISQQAAQEMRKYLANAQIASDGLTYTLPAGVISISDAQSHINELSKHVVSMMHEPETMFTLQDGHTIRLKEMFHPQAAEKQVQRK